MKAFSTGADSVPDEPSLEFKGRYTVTLIPGDGVGPELVHCVKQVFRLVVTTS